jgi:hypothetical protein
MSQVVVTADSLKARRLKSGEREEQIDREGEFDKWRIASIAGFDPIAAAVGLAVMPIVISWYIIGFFVKFAIYVAISVSRVVGHLLGAKK